MEQINPNEYSDFPGESEVERDKPAFQLGRELIFNANTALAEDLPPREPQQIAS